MSYKPNRRSVLKTIAGTGVGLSLVTSTAAEETERYVAAVKNKHARDEVEAAGFGIVADIEAADVLVLEGASDSAEQLRGLKGVDKAAPDVEYQVDDTVEEDVPDDHYPDGYDNEIMELEEAHEYATGEGSTLAIIDTGVWAGHPDLGNVNVDKSRNFVDGEEGPHIGDRNYHGTHVAGIAGATGEEEVTGVAPDAELVSLRVFPESGGAPVSNSYLALDYAAEIGADAANMSLGSPPQPPQDNAKASRETFRVARKRVVRSVVQRGTAVVTSAGNDATNLQQGGWFSLWGSLPNTIGVSATDAHDELADFSNYGTSDISLAAPGYYVHSTFDPDNSALPGREYAYVSGTSMSAPQVTGLVGLAKELDPGLNPQQVEQRMAQNADLANGNSHPEFGGGRINALSTVKDLS